MFDLIIACILLVLSINQAFFLYFLKKQGRKINEWEEYKGARETLLKNLADPVQIEKDFESSANRLDALHAQRLTVPRADAGPHARVWRPKAMRSTQPRRWNPPADYDPRIGKKSN